MSDKKRKAFTEMKIFSFAPSHRTDALNRMFKDAGFQIAESISDRYDAVCLAGGEDICPFLYGERPLQETDYNVGRDLEEIKFIKSLDPGLLKIGICRGGQLLNVIYGGSMYQHVDNHRSGEHDIVVDLSIKDQKPETVKCNSHHHQLMIPGPNFTVIGKAYRSTKRKTQSEDYDINRNLEEEKWTADPEIMYDWSTSSLCFQPHPEYADNDTRKLFMKLVKYYID